MPKIELTPAAAEALKGPFAVEYHDNWPDKYGISGCVPGEDDEENTDDDERGRHDVRRRAIELLPEALALLSLAQGLMIDADDRGELDDGDETALRGRALLNGTREVLRSINHAAAAHEHEPVDAPPEEFRRWLAEGVAEEAHVGDPYGDVQNPFALFLSHKHGRPASVGNRVVRLGEEETVKLTLPYMDRFLDVARRECAGPVLGAERAIRILDEVLAGAHDEPSEAEEG